MSSLSPGQLRITEEERFAQRIAHAVSLLKESIDVDKARMGGIPCLKNTRVSAAQILAQIAEGDSVDDLVDDMEIDREILLAFLNGLSIALNRPVP